MKLLEWEFLKQGYIRLGHYRFVLNRGPKTILAILDEDLDEATIIIEYRKGMDLSRDPSEGPAWEKIWPNGKTAIREFWKDGKMISVEIYDEKGDRLSC